MVFCQSCCPAAAPALRPTLFHLPPVRVSTCGTRPSRCWKIPRCWKCRCDWTKGRRPGNPGPSIASPRPQPLPPLSVEGMECPRARGRWEAAECPVTHYPCRGPPSPGCSARRHVLFLPSSPTSEPELRIWSSSQDVVPEKWTWNQSQRARPACWREKGGKQK